MRVLIVEDEKVQARGLERMVRSVLGSRLESLDWKASFTAADCALLGVPQTASKEEIRRAFYKHAKQNHPDQGGDVEKFRQLMDAYTRLTGGS